MIDPAWLAADMSAVPVISTPPFFDALATTVGALSGALYAWRKGFDVLGTLAIAFATGLGGGVIRDLILVRGTPAFLTNPYYLAYAVLGAIVGFLFARRASRWQFAYDALDVATVGVWVLIGCQKAIIAGLPPISVVFVGVLASVGGGLLRDLLCGDIPAALRPGQWFALASFLAALTYVALNQAGITAIADEVLTLVVAAAFRWLSVKSRFTPPMPMDLSHLRTRSSTSN